MSTRKTKIDQKDVLYFLQRHFQKDISQLTVLKGGELSCPFSFTVADEAYIIRIDKQIESYKKDAYAWHTFASADLPIPEMISLGKMDNTHFYAITKKVNGKTLDLFSDKEIHAMMSSIIATLDAIHSIDISQTKGYGYMDTKDGAPYASWKEYITGVNTQNEEWIKNPVQKYEPLLQQIHKKILSLEQFLPEDRYLLHGDFGFNNVIADGRKITAVLDWGEARYGDFAYDIAWLDMWQHTILYEDIFHDHYIKTGKNVTHFNKRILAYKLCIYYCSVRFFLQSGQIDELEQMIKDSTHLLV